MRTKIGIYEYSRPEENVINVFYNDNAEEPKDVLVMVFLLRDSQIFSQGNIDDPDYIEIYGNAIDIFKGNIVVEI